jgi:hypothetical protein
VVDESKQWKEAVNQVQDKKGNSRSNNISDKEKK